MEKKQRFSLRKTTKGLVSALIAGALIVPIFGDFAAAEVNRQKTDADHPHVSQPPEDLRWTANSVSEIETEIQEQLKTQDASSEDYVIQWGDTVWGITQAYGLDLDAFVTANGIVNPDLVYTNDIVTLDIDEILRELENTVSADNVGTTNNGLVQETTDTDQEDSEVADPVAKQEEVEEKEEDAGNFGAVEDEEIDVDAPAPAEPEIPAKPEVPKVPVEPEEQEIPEEPEEPEAPVVPEEPEVPAEPETPEEPEASEDNECELEYWGEVPSEYGDTTGYSYVESRETVDGEHYEYIPEEGIESEESLTEYEVSYEFLEPEEETIPAEYAEPENEDEEPILVRDEYIRRLEKHNKVTPIRPAVVAKHDPEMFAGETRVKWGTDGQLIEKIVETYEDGILVSSEVVETERIEPEVSVRYYGTKAPEVEKKVEIQTEETEILHGSTVYGNPDLAPMEHRITREGQNGVRTRVYERTFMDDVLVDEVLVEETITEPVNEIVELSMQADFETETEETADYTVTMDLDEVSRNPYGTWYAPRPPECQVHNLV